MTWLIEQRIDMLTVRGVASASQAGAECKIILINWRNGLKSIQ